MNGRKPNVLVTAAALALLTIGAACLIYIIVRLV